MKALPLAPLALLVLIAACRSQPVAPPGACDLLIVGARIVDGSGAPAFEGDLLVRDGRIAAVGRVEREGLAVRRVIEARGRVLAPGFIDLHAHGDPLESDFEGALAMGVTTVVLGQDGRSTGARWNAEAQRVEGGLAAWVAEAERRGLPLNAVTMSGHGTLRRQTGLGPRPGPATPAELAALGDALRADLDAGAFGLTTGLEYVPGMHAETAELVALARVVGEREGLVMSHLRSEDDDRIEASIAELAAQGAHARVHISHLKIVYGRGAERGRRLLAHLKSLREGGLRLSADIYPYTAGYTGVAILFPPWALPPHDYDTVVAQRRGELAEYLRARVRRRNGPEALLLGSPSHLAGRTLAEASAKAGQAFEDFLIDLGPGGAAGAHFTQDTDTHDVLVTSPLTAISTDGGPTVPHPRSTGTYAKLLAHYVRERGLLTLEEAVHQASGLPAAVLGLTDRGVLRAGAVADLVLFDPEAVQARSSYLEPDALAAGFDLTVVHGEIAREGGQQSGARPGRVLRP